MRLTAHLALLLLAGAQLPAVARGAGMRDEPLLGDATQLLDGGAWTVSDNATTVAAAVPGDLVTDLQRAGVVGDPLFELAFKSLVWDRQWQYALSFATEPAAAGGARWLVLDSVKMGAWVWLNGVYLGAVQDQFLRFTYDVSAVLKAPGAGPNRLTVTFAQSNHSLNDQARWMAASGRWDWAAETSTYNSVGAHTFSKGIVRSVYLVAVGAAAVEHLQTRIFYAGSYPTAPLTDASAGPWNVVARVHLLAPAPASGTVQVRGAWGGLASSPASLVAGNNTVEVTLSVPAGAVNLWWPNGLGQQARYNITATWTPAAGPPLTTSRAVGFRFFALVTGNDTDPSTLAGKDGSDSFTMRFNVNGAKVWSRGANLIPMDELEGRLSEDAHIAMLRSAAAAHMNTLRVWGGGSFYNDVVYDTADELGLMMYHDMMYGQPWFGGNSGVPTQNAMQDAEMRYQLRRLSHHPSIMLWDACNECSSKALWFSFVVPTIADEEPSRPLWPACPSTGFAGGVDRLTGLANGRPLVLKSAAGLTPAPAPVAATLPALPPAAACTPYANADYAQGAIWVDAPAADLGACCDACTAQAGCVAGVLYQNVCYMKNASMVQQPSWAPGLASVWVAGQTPVAPPSGGCNKGLTLETHGYYQHGEGFKTIDSSADLQPFSPNVPPMLDPSYDIGPHCPGTYASEFGASVWSSFESMSPTLDPAHWSAHADVMYERNYALDNFLVAYYDVAWPGYIANSTFQAQLFLSMVAQGLLVKSDISTRRARNSWGTVTWQLNE